MNRIAVLVVAVLALLAAAASSLFVVDRGQFAAVYAMGQIRRVQTQPGLYFKWPAPLENVVLVDNRLRTLRNDRTDTFATAGKQSVVVGWYLKWRVSDASAFIRKFGGSEASVGERMSEAVRAALGEQIGARDVSALLAQQASEVAPAVRDKVQAALQGDGVKVVDWALTRVDFTADVTTAVYANMTSARQLAAGKIRADGQAEADRIRADADREREQVLADAYRKAQVLKGQGDARAAAIYAKAFGQDPEFAAFYRSLEAYRASFNSRSDVLVLDPSSAFFRFMRSPDGAAPSPAHKR